MSVAMAAIVREQALQRWQAQCTAGKPIIGCAVGTGISARCSDAAGADFLVIYNAAPHKLDLLTAPYVFDEEQAIAMAQAGADMLVVDVRVTASGSTGAIVTLTLDEAIDQVLRITATGRTVKRDLLVICHGGPFGEPQVVGAALLRMPGVNGFLGAATTERLPIERAITGQVAQFKELRLA